MWILISCEPDTRSLDGVSNFERSYKPVRYGYYWLPKQYHPYSFKYPRKEGGVWYVESTEQLLFGSALEVVRVPNR